MSGNGKIGELYYKPKSSLPVNTLIDLSVSNAKKISSSGVRSDLVGGSTSVVTSNDVVGLNSISGFQNSFTFFPNPASDHLKIQSTATIEVSYKIIDIVGREISKGAFTNSKVIDLSGIESGTYFFKFESGKETFYNKVIVKN